MKRRNGHGKTLAVPDVPVNGHTDGEPPDGWQPPASPDEPMRELPARGELAGESTDPLTLYLRDVRRTELFTPEQEHECAVRARARAQSGPGPSTPCRPRR